MSFGTKATTKKEEAGKTKKEEVGKKGWEVKEEGKEEKVPEGVRGKGQQDKKAEAAKKDVKVGFLALKHSLLLPFVLIGFSTAETSRAHPVPHSPIREQD